MVASASAKRKTARSGTVMHPNWEIVFPSILVLFFMLAPLDRSFPGLSLAGKTLNSPSAVSMLAFGLAYFSSKGKILLGFKNQYIRYQLVFVAVLALSCMGAADPLNAFQGVVRYFATFVLDYVLFSYLIGRHGFRWLTRAVIFGGTLAATIACADTLAGVRLGFYQKFLDLNAEASGKATLGASAFDTFRGTGTMGNPILMAMLMMLCIPYVFNLKSRTLRVIVLAILFMGAAVTVTRTIAVGVFVFLIGCAIIYGARFWKTIAITFAVTVTLLATSVGTFLQDDPRVAIWQSRLGIGESKGGEKADDNVTVRRDVAVMALNKYASSGNPKELLLGAGNGTTSKIGESYLSGFETIDNSNITLLYEEGIFGLAAFWAAFLVILRNTRRRAKTSLHWYNAVALLACGISFDFEGYSTFNLLVVGSLAIVSVAPEICLETGYLDPSPAPLEQGESAEGSKPSEPAG